MQCAVWFAENMCRADDSCDWMRSLIIHNVHLKIAHNQMPKRFVRSNVGYHRTTFIGCYTCPNNLPYFSMTFISMFDKLSARENGGEKRPPDSVSVHEKWAIVKPRDGGCVIRCDCSIMKCDSILSICGNLCRMCEHGTISLLLLPSIAEMPAFTPRSAATYTNTHTQLSLPARLRCSIAKRFPNEWGSY